MVIIKKRKSITDIDFFFFREKEQIIDSGMGIELNFGVVVKSSDSVKPS